MKIAILHSGFMPVPPLRGGAVEKMWHRLGIEFAARGHEVTHVCRLCDGQPADERLEGVRYRRATGFDRPPSTLFATWLDLRWIARARRLVPAADIVVTNSICAPVLLRARQGAIYVDVQRMPKGQVRFYRRAARLRANSSAVAEAIVAEAPALAARVRMIPNPLPFVPAHPVCWDAKTKTVLFAGRLHPEKGIELLLRAWTLARGNGRLAGWQLELIGPTDTAGGGGGSAWAEALQRRFAAPDIAWRPALYDVAELSRAYERATIFVYPSLAEKGETFGLAALEAMAWGAVPVVSNLACFRDFIVPGVNGWVFDHRAADPATALATALERAAGADSRALGEAAVAVRETHSSAAIAEQFLADFAHLA